MALITSGCGNAVQRAPCAPNGPNHLGLCALQEEEAGATRLSFDGVEQWWKARMGLFEADTPVIPEYISYKLVSRF